jgi:hypothetical protein
MSKTIPDATGDVLKMLVKQLRKEIAEAKAAPPELSFEMRGRDLLIRSGPHTQVFMLPFPLHVGVWAENRGYAQGDGVSHRGSWWIAQRDTSAGERPGVATGAPGACR